MKTRKILLTVILSIFAISLNAQLKMSSTGDTSIGNTSPIKGVKMNIEATENESAVSIRAQVMPNGGDILKVLSKNPAATAFAAWTIDSNGRFINKNLDIRVNGDIYSRSVLITSDERAKEDIKTINSPLNKLMNIRGVSYNLKSEIQERQTNSALTKTHTQVSKDETMRHLGVIAQEVQAVFPEAVRTTEDGVLAVSYSDLVGVLIEAVKEQQTQIEELQSLVGKTSIKTRSASDIGDVSSIESTVISSNALYQNNPNPFSTSTKINYILDESVQQANLYIYDMQGVQIKNITDLSKGNGSITIEGYELTAGMYIYSLIADGKEIDTKRMILTK